MRRPVVSVSDKMQRNYRYELVEPEARDFDAEFRPELTPPAPPTGNLRRQIYDGRRSSATSGCACTARVSKSKGRMISVAGSSFMVSTKTISTDVSRLPTLGVAAGGLVAEIPHGLEHQAQVSCVVAQSTGYATRV